MKRIIENDLQRIIDYFKAAAEIAKHATCERARCGSVIVKDDKIIGTGCNAPPLDDENRRVCGKQWDYSKKPKYDLTCCVHAEWRAVLDACKKVGDSIEGSTLYFMRIDENGNFTDAGQPFCTVCSRLTMEAGVAFFALWNNNGADVYELAEYGALSYDYYKE